MKSGRTNATGQLRPLRDRMNANDLSRRSEKNEYRRLVSLEHAKTRGAVIMVGQQTARLQTRLKWLTVVTIAGQIALAVWQYLG
jgi:hypothetical protein